MTLEHVAVVLLLLILLLLAILLRQGAKRDRVLAAMAKSSREQTDALGNRLFGRIETYLSLRDRLGLRQGLAYDHDWSAAPDFLRLIVEYALTRGPAQIVECGSGLTTLMLARCCAMNGRGRIVSLENGVDFAAKTRAEIARHGLDAYADVLDAPLTRHTLDGVEYQWYALDRLPNEGIDMLVIDGPPGFIQRHSRYPALPLLFERMSAHGIIFMDDAARPDEREIVEMWRKRYPSSRYEYIETERGCAIVRIGSR